MNKFIILACNMEVLNKKIEKLNKKARKLGQPEIIAKVLASTTVKERVQNEDGVEVSVSLKAYELEIEGVSPKIPGYEFLGTIEFSEAGNILRSVPGFEIPESYRTATKTCEHCNKIRNRKDTYVVRHESGETKQIGHNCIRDYLGHVSPEHLARMAEFLRSVKEMSGFSGERPALDLTKDFLEMAAQIVLTDGYTSRAAVQNNPTLTSTSCKVSAQLHPPKPLPRDFVQVSVSNEAKELAKKVSDYVTGLDAKSQYEANLKVILSNETVDFRNFGLLASSISFYQKAMGMEQERKAKAAISQHFGEVGKRQDFELTVTNEHQFKSQFGITSIYRMADSAGNVAVWFTACGTLEVGKTYILKGTVKEHSEYKETKQTVLSRCKVLSVKEEAAA